MASTVLFNNPLGSPKEQFSIVRSLVRDIEDAPPGSEIELVVYSLGLRSVAAALGEASRHSRVRVLVDAHLKATSTNRLQVKLGRVPFNGLRYVHGAARGVGGNTHTKVWKIKHPDGTYIIYIGSSNLTRFAAVKQYQDMVRITGKNAVLWGGLHALFEEQWERQPVAAPFTRTRAAGYVIHSYPNPGATEARGDIAAERLRWVARHSNDAHLVVAMHAMNDARGLYLARSLAHLAEGGVPVHVLAGIGTGPRVRRTLERSPVNVRDGVYQHGVHIHHKFALAIATRPRGGVAQRVWTGSDNWTSDSLHREETVLRLRNELYDEYSEHFARLWRAAK